MCNNEKQSGEAKTAWIAFIAAIIASTITAVSGFYLHYLEAKQRAEKELLANRREALLEALEVIDNVYANVDFYNAKGEVVPKTKPHNWPMQKARNAINKMLIYCADPANAFSGANRPGKPEQIGHPNRS